MRLLLVAAMVILTACGAAQVSEAPQSSSDTVADAATTTTVARPSTTTTVATTSSSTAGSTTPTTLASPKLVDPDVIGVWPYRTADEVLTAAVDGIDVNEVELVRAFLSDTAGWELGPILESRDGTDFMSFTFESTGGTFYVATQIVGYSPDGSAVVAISSASSLDFLEDGWGPGIDIGESEEGWSAIVTATPIASLTEQPGVTGPYAQLYYGEWESGSKLIGQNGASIAMPVTPDIPGVLSIWYFDARDSIVGFSLYALPAGSFVAG